MKKQERSLKPVPAVAFLIAWAVFLSPALLSAQNGDWSLVSLPVADPDTAVQVTSVTSTGTAVEAVTLGGSGIAGVSEVTLQWYIAAVVACDEESETFNILDQGTTGLIPVFGNTGEGDVSVSHPVVDFAEQAPGFWDDATQSLSGDYRTLVVTGDVYFSDGSFAPASVYSADQLSWFLTSVLAAAAPCPKQECKFNGKVFGCVNSKHKIWCENQNQGQDCTNHTCK